MDVRPIMPIPTAGSAEPGAPIRAAIADSARILAATMDTVAVLQLSPSDTSNLVSILEPPALPQQPSTLADLLRGAASAAQKGDVGDALKQLENFVRLDPNRANTLRLEPDLQQIRAHVDQLLTRLESIARLDAQNWLAQAAKALESWGRQPLPGWDAAPHMLLTVADRMYDAGGYVNYLYAASLAQAVIGGARVPSETVRKGPADSAPKSIPAPKSSHRLEELWARAPLLILLAGWLVLGLAALGLVAILHYFWPAQFPQTAIDGGFALWGIGFVVLVAFGFLMRIRHIRFR